MTLLLCLPARGHALVGATDHEAEECGTRPADYACTSNEEGIVVSVQICVIYGICSRCAAVTVAFCVVQTKHGTSIPARVTRVN